MVQLVKFEGASSSRLLKVLLESPFKSGQPLDLTHAICQRRRR